MGADDSGPVCLIGWVMSSSGRFSADMMMILMMNQKLNVTAQSICREIWIQSARDLIDLANGMVILAQFSSIFSTRILIAWWNYASGFLKLRDNCDELVVFGDTVGYSLKYNLPLLAFLMERFIIFMKIVYFLIWY